MSTQLEKGQEIVLNKLDGSPYSYIYLAAGWDAQASNHGLLSQLFGEDAIDLDASLLLLDQDHALIEAIYFGQLSSSDGSITHSGDNYNAQGGDKETIHINLSRVPKDVECMVFCLNSFCGQSFENINQVSCAAVDATTHQPIAQFQISQCGASTGLIISKITRYRLSWQLSSIGVCCEGQSFKEMMPIIRDILMDEKSAQASDQTFN